MSDADAFDCPSCVELSSELRERTAQRNEARAELAREYRDSNAVRRDELKAVIEEVRGRIDGARGFYQDRAGVFANHPYKELLEWLEARL